MAGLRPENADEYEETGIDLVRRCDAGLHPTMRHAPVGMTTAMMSVVALLLLIAWVNVAALVLARARR